MSLSALPGDAPPAAPELSVVVPVFNERDNLEPLAAELRAVLAVMARPAEVLFVDDGSTDGSTAVLRGLVQAAPADGEPTVRVLQLRRNSGQTAALAAGFDHALGDVIVSIDGDGQNDPADIPRLVARLEEGYDVVSGWRSRRRDGAISRRLPSRVANWLVGLVSGLELHDYGCTLKAYRRKRLREVDLYGEMHRFIPAYVAGLGGRVTELEVGHRPRLHGKSKYGWGRAHKVLLDLVLIRFMTRYLTRPMHFFGQISLQFFLLTGVVGVLMLAFKYGWLRVVGVDYQASFIQTPLPALAATFFLGGVMSLFFGVLGEVLIRVLHDAQGIKPYRLVGLQELPPERPRQPSGS